MPDHSIAGRHRFVYTLQVALHDKGHGGIGTSLVT